ncbi:hypothetical protein V5F53_12200 [Xanthobacter sp. V4C-4]|uniref:hypothetical protein n=1 Tax=Xanthobacter cornucopiae TaxID=3119924 RepID=UPI0037284E9A
MPDPSQALTYSYHPRLGGAGVRLTLEDDALGWLVGPREGRLRLADIARLHLRFQPAKFAAATFELEILGREGSRLVAASASRTSLTAVRDQGPDYARFVRALHGAVAAAGVPVACQGGYGRLRWGLMVALGALAGLGLLAVVAFALAEAQWTTAGLIALLSALVGWPTVETLARNRPIRYRLDALPAHLLPA